MKPLIVLIAGSLIAYSILILLHYDNAILLAARVGMSAMLLFTAIGHFAFTKGMMMMLPSSVPGKKILVYATGLLEILAAITLQIPALVYPTGWFLVVFFILLLPANMYAAIRKVDYQKATLNGNGTGYLWFRVPLQLFFIAWVYFSTIDQTLNYEG